VVGTPSGPAEQVTENHFSNFTIVRDGPAAPHPSGDIRQYPTGLRVTHVLRGTFRDISSHESSVGFYFGGTVYTRVDDCLAQRVRPGVGPGQDYWVGYFLDGKVRFGYPGGNASIYIHRCVAADQHPSHVDATALRAEGAFVDTFLDLFESARIATGIVFALARNHSYGAAIDTHIRDAIVDGCSRAGIDIDLDGTPTGSIEIVDPYVAGSGDVGIQIRDGAGLATITGGQVHGAFTKGSVRIARTRGVRVAGTKIHQAVLPMAVEEADACQLEPQISNADKTSTEFAVTCRSISRSTVRPILMGFVKPAFRGGISITGASANCQFDTTAVDPACFIEPDASWKVRFNGGDARGGASGQAFRAAGNLLAGVLT
jgi:hypothetical protein